MKEYNHKKIELKWQKEWEKNKIYSPSLKSKKSKFYTLVEFPYPSGDGLHVGHPRSYVGMDVVSRKKRMEGYNVLYPMGWDAFGLPTENYAIKTGIHPKIVTKKNTDNFRKQIKMLGISFDWTREINTTDESYYKWTQWIFLQFFKKGLAYKAKSEINWCPKDKIGLANEEVIDGKCERCGTDCEKREKEQWMLAITKYADRLDKDLDLVDYPERVKSSQRNWIGRSEGSEIDFTVKGENNIKHVVILHGRNGTPSNYVFPWLKKEFEKRGYTVELPKLPNTEEPNDEEQADYVQKYCTLNENTMIVGQSFGGIVAMRLLERGVKVGRVVMAVVPFSGKFNDKKNRKSATLACKKGFDFESIKKNAKEFIVLRDIKDTIVPYEDAELWHKNLNGKLINGTGVVPHFSGEKEPDMVMASVPTIRVFTTRADTLFGVTYVVLAPEHPLVESLKFKVENEENKKEIEEYLNKTKNKSDLERAENKEKTGVELKGIKVINPASGEEIPVWIADYVLPHYGTGAVMAVPAHDERDFEFAKKYNLPWKRVVEPIFIQKEGDGSVKENMPFIRRNAICAIVRNPKTNKYLCTSWKNYHMHGLITGGIDDGEDPIKAALREIYEETGYKNIKLVRDPKFALHSQFYHRVKKENRWARFQYFFFDLIDEEKDSISEKESALHEILWKTKDEIKTFFTVIEGQFTFNFINDPDYIYTGDGLLHNSFKFDDFESKEACKKITEEVGGKMVTKFKLRDWVFSRQRYWGEPIPVVNCQKCGLVAVRDTELPLKLPVVKSYKLTDTGESPLANITKWVNTKCPKCKGLAKRETDTMPNWAGSSWYYLRYTDVKNKKEFASKENLKYWLGNKKESGGVDWYNGGMEHTTLHLLYSRFWHKFLYDLKLVPTIEPYKKRTSHGMILGAGGVKMSKSLGNVVNPNDIVKTYGADTLRVYEMFIGPFEETAVWNTDSIIGARRFIEKVWRIREKVEDKNKNFQSNVLIQKLLNKTIKKVGEDIEIMRFNTAISAMMILATEMEKYEVSINDYKKFLKILAPFAPHVSEEIWMSLGENKSINISDWPKFDEKLIKDDEIKIAIQVNGKVRAEMMINVSEEEEGIKQRAVKDQDVLKFISGKEIKKIIYVKNRLVNIVAN
jgi:leucyl-tRNA synthetase